MPDSDTTKGELSDRERELDYHITEMIGTMMEYVQMPCDSLRDRMAQSALRAEGARSRLRGYDSDTVSARINILRELLKAP